MDKTEIQSIGPFLSDVSEGILEGDEAATTQQELTELYRVIELLMDETFKTEDQSLKVFLAHLEYWARQYKQEIEQRLGVRN
jgi:hypothetical protein